MVAILTNKQKVRAVVENVREKEILEVSKDTLDTVSGQRFGSGSLLPEGNDISHVPRMKIGELFLNLLIIFYSSMSFLRCGRIRGDIYITLAECTQQRLLATVLSSHFSPLNSSSILFYLLLHLAP